MELGVDLLGGDAVVGGVDGVVLGGGAAALGLELDGELEAVDEGGERVGVEGAAAVRRLQTGRRMQGMLISAGRTAGRG